MRGDARGWNVLEGTSSLAYKKPGRTHTALRTASAFIPYGCSVRHCLRSASFSASIAKVYTYFVYTFWVVVAQLCLVTSHREFFGYSVRSVIKVNVLVFLNLGCFVLRSRIRY